MHDDKQQKKTLNFCSTTLIYKPCNNAALNRADSYFEIFVICAPSWL